MRPSKQLATLVVLLATACAEPQLPTKPLNTEAGQPSGETAPIFDSHEELALGDRAAAKGAKVSRETITAVPMSQALPGTVTTASDAGSQQHLSDSVIATSRPKSAATSIGQPQMTPTAGINRGLADRENYLHYPDSAVTAVTEQPVSTFSVDVDTASYANIRRMLVREGRLPPSDAVCLEEMINYFSYQYATPVTGEHPFNVTTELAPAPWSEQRYLLRIGLRGFEPGAEQRPPANLVFLVDVSGSMQAPEKLGLVKSSLRLLVNRMNTRDRIALVAYAGAAGVILDSTPGSNKAKILTAIDSLRAGGSTHGSAGITLAYQLAEQHKIEGGINRVLIASDGDMNVGTVSIGALKDLITQKRAAGIALTTLGYGTGNYNYALMEQLADVGNGNASYIDSLSEAQKVLVNELHSTLMIIASDVKIQVEFNPAQVSEYRLIGYENRLMAREDFTNDRADAGDIGAGHSVTALYEIALTGSEGQQLPPLRYRQTGIPADLLAKDHNPELAYIKLRYKLPQRSDSVELGTPVTRSDVLPTLAAGSDDLRFAASVAGFGQLLQGGRHTGAWDYDDAFTLAREARGRDPYGYRSEFLRLVELARSIATGS